MDVGGPDVQVDAGAAPSAPIPLIVSAVRRTLASEGLAVAEISVALLGDEEMRGLHAKYLGVDRPTDVLAFSLGGGGEVIGDVYIGFEQAQRQAEELAIPIEEELVRLAIHGTLHVLGHEHPEGPERAGCEMFQLQERLLEGVLKEAGSA